MKSLVTGGTGFIGSHLVDHLIRAGHEVTVLVRPTSRLRWLENKPIRLVTGDIKEADSLIEPIMGQDLIFHVAGVVVARSSRDFDETNHQGTKNIMETILRYNPKLHKVIYVSSLGAGGSTSPDHPLTEQDLSHPLSPYGQSKYAGEQVVLSHRHQLKVAVVRPPVVYGPRDKGVLGFFQLVAKHIKVNVGYRDRYVTVIYVSDLVTAIMLAATRETKSGELYYVDDGTPTRTWLELQSEITRALKTWSIKLRVPLAPLFVTAAVLQGIEHVSGRTFRLDLGKYRELSQQAWLCDGTKIRKELGYRPEVTLEEGILSTARWYREMEWI